MFSDFRYALRQLRKSPGFTAVVILTLALGIGANATVLCWLRNLVERPVPGAVDQPSLTVILSNWGGGNASLADVRDLGALDTVLTGSAVSTTVGSGAGVSVSPAKIGNSKRESSVESAKSPTTTRIALASTAHPKPIHPRPRGRGARCAPTRSTSSGSSSNRSRGKLAI